MFIFNLGNDDEGNLVFILLATGLVTIIPVSFTLFVIRFDRSAKKYTKLFVIVQNLLLCGLFIAALAILDVIASSIIKPDDFKSEYLYCFFEFVSRKYLYQASFIWNSLLAIYFLQTTIRNVEPEWINREQSIRRRTTTFLFKLYELQSFYFWLAAFTFIIPSIACDVYSFVRIRNEYTAYNLKNNFSYAVLRVNKGENMQIICTSNTTTDVGRFLDILFFELILAITLFFNIAIYSYSTYKIWVNSPISVVEREMKKSSGYIIIQLVVWLPSFISNVVHISKHTPTNIESGFKIIVALNSLQGFLNCVVYIYNDRMFRKWMQIAVQSICNKKQEVKKSGFNPDSEIRMSQRQVTIDIDKDFPNYDNRTTFTVSAVKSILHKSSDKNMDFENKKFVKFRDYNDIRFIGGQPNRLTDPLITNRISNDLTLNERNY